jgi:hypothetical protein
MKKQPRGDSSGGSSSGPQIPTRNFTTADLQRVAAAGEIPEEQLPKLRSWLRYAVDRYDEDSRVYGSILTKPQRLKCFSDINKAARRLNKLLKQPWPGAAMMSHEALSLLSRRNDIGKSRHFDKAWQAVENRVRRDLKGVQSLVDRSAAILKELESRGETSDEKLAATSAADPARELLDHLIWNYWVKELRNAPPIGKNSPFVRFVRAIDRLVGFSGEAPVRTIRYRYQKFATPGGN